MQPAQDAPRPGERMPAEGFEFTVRWEESRALTEAEERSVLALFSRAFNGGPSWFNLGVQPLDHLRWKTRDIPGASMVELLEVGERIVGAIYALRRPFLIRGKERMIRDAVDLAIDPELQGRGVQSFRIMKLTPLRKQLFPEMALNWDLTAHPTSWHLRERRGGLALGNYLETQVKPLRLRRLLSRLRGEGSQRGPSRTRTVLEAGAPRWRRRLERAGLAARLVSSRLRPEPRQTSPVGVTIRSVDRFDGVAGFWPEAAAPFDFIQVRDAAFLNWRFCDARGGPFVVRVAEAEGRMLGYAALRLGEREAVLADLLTLPDHPRVVNALLEDAIQVARTRGAAALRAWLMHEHPYREALRRHGFVAMPAVVGLGYEPWWMDPAELAFLQEPSARVHVMLADSDHV